MSCCGGRRKNPVITQQAKNLTLSVINVIANAIKTGKIKASKEIIEHRIKLCQSCRHLNGVRCNVCGCFISLKAGLQSEKCPIKKW